MEGVRETKVALLKVDIGVLEGGSPAIPTDSRVFAILPNLNVGTRKVGKDPECTTEDEGEGQGGPSLIEFATTLWSGPLLREGITLL